MMPGLSGYDVLEELRANPETAAIPVIFLTALVDRTHMRHGMELGAEDYLTKPFTFEELLAAIDTCLARRTALIHATETQTMQQTRSQVRHLERAASRVEAILNSSHDAILFTYADGSIRQSNLTFSEMFGYRLDEEFNQPLASLVTSSSQDTVGQVLLAVAEGWQPHPIEVVARRRDGTTFDADLTLVVVDEDDDTIGLVCTIHDITKYKQTEESLRNALEKERELRELKSRFISMVSHEFRTPLATIQVATDTLRSYMDQMDDQQRTRRFDKIQTQIGHMTALLEDVLFIGRAEAGANEFHPMRLDLDAFCRDIVDEFQQRTVDSHQVVYSVTGDCTDILLDMKLMRQIITNLLSNAIKYSPHGGTISVQLASDSEQIILRVKDEGIGISDKDQKKLFEAFHRAENVGALPGTGLGLAIVHHAVGLHEGTISLESQLGEGTIFTIIIPQYHTEG
jgi:PAS domain S-box-containing protein